MCFGEILPKISHIIVIFPHRMVILSVKSVFLAYVLLQLLLCSVHCVVNCVICCVLWNYMHFDVFLFVKMHVCQWNQEKTCTNTSFCDFFNLDQHISALCILCMCLLLVYITFRHPSSLKMCCFLWFSVFLCHCLHFVVYLCVKMHFCKWN